MVTTRGWVEGSGQKVLPFAELLLSYGVTVIVYTDISRDGMLTGPNFDMLGKLQKLEGISLIASGGRFCLTGAASKMARFRVSKRGR